MRYSSNVNRVPENVIVQFSGTRDLQETVSGYPIFTANNLRVPENGINADLVNFRARHKEKER